MRLRFADNSDQDKIIQLIDGVLAEYDDSVCLERSEADLLDIQGCFFDKGGAFWVLEDPESCAILGTHAVLPVDASVGVCYFKRLYLSKALRGTEWGRALMQTTIDWSRDQGLKRVEFWSDTRFSRAHRFFEKFGFERSGEVRTMNDSHETYQEYFYFLNL